MIEPLLKTLNVENLITQFFIVPNRFFGESVTVTGLLTGNDIIETLRDKDLGDAVIIPGITLKQGEEVFLDNLHVEDVAKKLPVPVHVAYGPEELLEKILGV